MHKFLKLAALPLFAAALACPAGAETSPEEAKTLFESKCSLCHPADRATSKQKNLEAWTATVKRMQTKKGSFTDAEAEAIIKHLATNHGM